MLAVRFGLYGVCLALLLAWCSESHASKTWYWGQEAGSVSHGQDYVATSKDGACHRFVDHKNGAHGGVPFGPYTYGGSTGTFCYLTNSPTYGGSGAYGFYSQVCPDNQWPVSGTIGDTVNCGTSGYPTPAAKGCASEASGGFFNTDTWQCGCPTDMTASGGVCAFPSCPWGKEWDVGTHSCQPSEDAPESCGAGQIANVDSDGTILSCSDLASPHGECTQIQGWHNGFPICNDNQQKCIDSGGTYGWSGDQEVCIPEDYGPPTCDFGHIVTITESGYVCTPGDPTPNPDLPGSGGDTSGTPGDQGQSDGNGKNLDTNSDGIPDAWDANGDGIADQIDQDEDGVPDSGVNSGKASASGSCAAAPTCTGGDAQQCAILRQVWLLQCAPLPDGYEPAKSPEAITQEGQATVEGNSDTVDFETGLSGWVRSDNNATASCPAPFSMVIRGTTIEFSWDFICDFADTIRAFVIFCFSMLSLASVRRILLEG